MASRRMIDPAFWQSESLMELSYRQRLLFIGLISNADDQGRLKGNPKLVKAAVFPFDDISADEVQTDLDELETVECLAIYKAGSKTCIQITNWWQYQHPQWAYPSELPPMEGWLDRLRYRQGGQVITNNWNGEKEANLEPPVSNNLNGASGNHSELPPKALGGSIGKALPKALGGSIVVSSSNRVSIDKKTTTTTAPVHDEPKNEFGEVCSLLAQGGLYLDGFTSQLVQDCYDDIAPPPGESRVNWFEYALAETAGSRRNWKYLETIVRNVNEAGGLSAHKANRMTKRKDTKNGQSRVNQGKQQASRTAQSVRHNPYQDNGRRITPAGLPIDPELLKQSGIRPN